MSSQAPPHKVETEADWSAIRSRLRAFVAKRVADDVATHDDLVQEILLRLHRGLPGLRDSERLDAFAYQIARNAIADHYRSARPELPVAPDSLAETAVALEQEPAGDDGDEARAQLSRCLRPLVDNLDDGYREALLLTDLGDLSQAAAARHLGLSAPGMRSRVQRGRAQLREALGRCCKIELDAAARLDTVERVGPCSCETE